MCRRARAYFVWLLVVCPVFLLLANRVFVSLPPLNGHAEGQHGRHAHMAYEAMCQHDPRKTAGYVRREDSAENRIYHILCLPSNGKRPAWAIVITTLTGFLVTAWITTSRRCTEKLMEKERTSHEQT